MQVSIAKNQQVTLTASMKDAANAEVAAEDLDQLNLPRWTEDSKKTIVKLEQHDDLKSIMVVGVSVGTANVTCIDPGSNNSDVIQVVVLADGVKSVKIAAGVVETRKTDVPPTPQPVPLLTFEPEPLTPEPPVISPPAP